MIFVDCLLTLNGRHPRSLQRFGSEAGEAPCITSAGFQFLLLDTASQLWYFTLQYLKTAQVAIQRSALTFLRLWNFDEPCAAAVSPTESLSSL